MQLQEGWAVRDYIYCWLQNSLMVKNKRRVCSWKVEGDTLQEEKWKSPIGLCERNWIPADSYVVTSTWIKVTKKAKTDNRVHEGYHTMRHQVTLLWAKSTSFFIFVLTCLCVCRWQECACMHVWHLRWSERIPIGTVCAARPLIRYSYPHAFLFIKHDQHFD